MIMCFFFKEKKNDPHKFKNKENFKAADVEYNVGNRSFGNDIYKKKKKKKEKKKKEHDCYCY